MGKEKGQNKTAKETGKISCGCLYRQCSFGRAVVGCPVVDKTVVHIVAFLVEIKSVQAKQGEVYAHTGTNNRKKESYGSGMIWFLSLSKKQTRPSVSHMVRQLAQVKLRSPSSRSTLGFGLTFVAFLPLPHFLLA